MPSTKGGLRSFQVSHGGPIPSLMIQAWADDIFLVNGTREEVCWGLLRKVSLWVERDAISSSFGSCHALHCSSYLTTMKAASL